MAYTLYVNSSGKLVTLEGNAVLPAQDRPELTAGVVYDFDIVPVAGAVAGTYTLSGDIKMDRRALMMQGTTSTVTEDGVIQFRNVSTDTLSFWDKPKSPGEKFYLRITLADSGKSISILEDHVFCRPGIAGDDTTPPPPNPGCVESVNSRTGNVVLTKSDVGLSNVQNILDNLNATAAPTATDDSSKGYSNGSRWIYAVKLYTCVDATAGAAIWTEGGGGAGDVTLAGDNAFLGENSFAEPITIAGNAVTGLIEDRSQITWPSVVDEKYDRCRYFDATFDVLNFVSMQVRVKQMRMVVVSANPTYTGNVVYVPYTASDKTFADQVAGDPIVVAVGATPAEVVFDLVVDKKFLRLVRDYSNVFDTLKDDTSTPITAIVPFYSVEVSNERPVA